ncbi:MAG: ABC transporter ATP-binding protein [Ruminococcaceae bacterium]|nr:ABC transporter ATP-binding protein [Oscillospiraceae bacterium]
MDKRTNKRDPVTVNLRPGGGPNHMARVMGEKPKNSKTTLIRLMKYIGSNKKYFFTIVAIICLSSAISIVAPLIQGKAIDTMESENVKLFFAILFTLGGIYLTQSLSTFIQSISAAKLTQATVRKMRDDLFSHISYLSIGYTDNHRHGDIMSRMTNDIESISNTVSTSVATIISGVIMLTGTLTVMLVKSPLLTAVSMISVILTLSSSFFLTKYMRKYFPKQQRLLGALNSHVEETVGGYNTIVAYTREENARKNFSKTNKELQKIGVLAQIFGGVMGPFMNVIGNIGFLLIAIVGGKIALESNQEIITLGMISTFITYSRQFSRPINEIAQQYAQIQTALAGAERVFEILDVEKEEDEGTDTEFDVENIKGEIEFNNVEFSYVPDKKVLDGFTLHVKPGEKIAIVGATGSGKTTVVNLLTRFYDIQKGEIILDGKDIFTLPKATLRSAIGIVLQDSVIFSDTIENNIRYGKEKSTKEEIISAAKMAGVDSFVKKLPDGYKTVLAESGANLSQGQRQLICIARAILNDPKILILDEATSNIDTRTEMNIQKAMIALMKNRTSLIIAHRLSTIRDADKIIVISNGKIAEIGNHEELLAKQGHYYTLYQNQFAGLKT